MMILRAVWRALWESTLIEKLILLVIVVGIVVECSMYLHARSNCGGVVIRDAAGLPACLQQGIRP